MSFVNMSPRRWTERLGSWNIFILTFKAITTSAEEFLLFHRVYPLVSSIMYISFKTWIWLLLFFTWFFTKISYNKIRLSLCNTKKNFAFLMTKKYFFSSCLCLSVCLSVHKATFVPMVPFDGKAALICRNIKSYFFLISDSSVPLKFKH